MLVFEFGTLNGGEHSMLAVLPQFVGTDFEFVALAPPGGPLTRSLTSLGVATVSFDVRDQRGQRRPSDPLFDELVAAIRRASPDVVHGNSLSMGRLIGLLAANSDATCTAHLRDIMGVSAEGIAQLNANRTLVAVSRAVREFHAAQGVEHDRMRVIYNGIDCERFAPRPVTGWLRRELNLPLDAFLFVSVGQICLRKGQDVFTKAAVRAAAHMPKSHFLSAGERYSEKDESLAFEQAMESEFATAGLSARFHRLGYRADVDRLLCEIDVLVHTARQEPFGRVLLEAAACGRPIIATAVGGTGEMLQHGDSALLVPADDPDAVSAAMIRLYDDAPLRARLGREARTRVLATFSLERAAGGLAEIWRSAIGD